MNQEKIGKFIAQCRNEKKLTQAELGEKLGVTEKSISNWENGRNMPDLSLFKPLCEILGIAINDLMSGEKIKKEDYQEKLEENIINTVNYKVYKNENKWGVILLVLGLFISILSMLIFQEENNSIIFIYSIGGILSFLGVIKLTIHFDTIRRYLFYISYILILIGCFFAIDYLLVVNGKRIPRFFSSKEIYNNMIIYNAPFYNVYRINYETDNEYYLVDSSKEYTKETVPNSPFNREKCGIAALLKYKSETLKNSKIDSILEVLPLSEYGYDLEMDFENLGIKIYYKKSEKIRKIENYYLEKSLIYNTNMLFTLIDDLGYIDFDLQEQSYHITREMMKELYPNFQHVAKKVVNEKFFNQYVEKVMNDNELILIYYKWIFIDANLKRTKKIVISGDGGKTITDEKDIEEIVNIFLYPTKRITGAVTWEGESYHFQMYDELDNLIYTLLVWKSSYGLYSKEYLISFEDLQKYLN